MKIKLLDSVDSCFSWSVKMSLPKVKSATIPQREEAFLESKNI